MNRKKNLTSTSHSQLLKRFIKWTSYHKVKIVFSIFLVAGFFIFFFRLDQPTIRRWDESRLAVTALEMTLNGNYLVAYFDGNPDMWNTKPPLLIWFIALCMKFFGYNEFSLRLPSAVCAMSTALILFLFAKIYFNNLKIGIISGLILITSAGFIGEHVARTGDYDAMLVLWTTIYSLSYFIYLNSDKSKENIYLSVTTVALVLAVLTKGIAGILALPGLIIYTSYQKKLEKILLASKVYYSIGIFIVLVLGYYLLREYYNPGYLKAVMKSELMRGATIIESHQGSFLFYFEQLKLKFIPWLYLLPVGLISQFNTKKIVKEFGVFGLFYLSFYFLIVSLSKTKLPWYDAPLYPIASLLIGIGISQVFDSLLNYYKINNVLKRQSILSVMILVFFFIPYVETAYYRVYNNQGVMYEWSQSSIPELMYGAYFKELFNTRPQLNKFSVFKKEDYNAHLLFYTKVANLSNHSIRLTSSNKFFNIDEVVVTCEPEAKTDLEQRYEMKTLHSSNSCYTFAIKRVKQEVE